MLQGKISKEIDKFNNEDFKNLYRQIKMLSLLNQLYDSDALTKQEFQQEENQITNKVKRLQAHLYEYDLEAFAKLYDIEREMKRMASDKMRSSVGTKQKDLLSIGLTLGSKFPQLQDTIHASKETREVKDVINILSEMTILLGKYRKLAKRLNKQLVEEIEKLNKIYQQFRKKKINEQFTAMQYYELEDAISKLWLQFETSLHSD